MDFEDVGGRERLEFLHGGEDGVACVAFAVAGLQQRDRARQEGQLLGGLGEGTQLAHHVAERGLGGVGAGDREVDELEHQLGVLGGAATGDPFVGLLEVDPRAGDAVSEQAFEGNLVDVTQTRRPDDVGEDRRRSDLIVVEERSSARQHAVDEEGLVGDRRLLQEDRHAVGEVEADRVERPDRRPVDDVGRLGCVHELVDVGGGVGAFGDPA